mmetsp:Transcript_11827/g.35961  ORF Transcript_11827/g.35961 Transcript_11827/m.35961 type:complete len:266 (+) Transcript_11827:163-960(+)
MKLGIVDPIRSAKWTCSSTSSKKSNRRSISTFSRTALDHDSSASTRIPSRDSLCSSSATQALASSPVLAILATTSRAAALAGALPLREPLKHSIATFATRSRGGNFGEERIAGSRTTSLSAVLQTRKAAVRHSTLTTASRSWVRPCSNIEGRADGAAELKQVAQSAARSFLSAPSLCFTWSADATVSIGTMTSLYVDRALVVLARPPRTSFTRPQPFPTSREACPPPPAQFSRTNSRSASHWSSGSDRRRSATSFAVSFEAMSAR